MYFIEAANVMLKLFGLTGIETYTKYATQYKTRAGRLHNINCRIKCKENKL